MRILVGICEDGHGFAVRVDTFERLKMAVMEDIMPHNKELALKVGMMKTEEELMDDEFIEELIEANCSYFQGRDYFTTLYDPMNPAPGVILDKNYR